MLYFQGRIVWDDKIFHPVTQNDNHKKIVIVITGALLLLF